MRPRRPTETERTVARAIVLALRLAAVMMLAWSLRRLDSWWISGGPPDPLDVLAGLYVLAVAVCIGLYLLIRVGFPLIAWLLWALHDHDHPGDVEDDDPRDDLGYRRDEGRGRG